MSASFPTAIASFSTKNPTDVIQAATDNSQQEEIVAIETELVNGFSRLRVAANSTTVAGGIITVTKSQYAVETEGAAGTDDLDTITAGSGVGAGALLLLTASNVSHVVTVKDSTGNIKLASGDCALNSAKRSLLLYYDGTNWVEIASPIQPTVTTPATTLLKANSGTDTTATATNVDTIALTGLTAKDRIIVDYTLESITQTTAAILLYNSTDSVAMARTNGGNNLTATNGLLAGRQILSQAQSAATRVISWDTGSMIGTPGPNASVSEIVSSTFTQNWTGSWTLALRHGGVTAGGTLRWSWLVTKVAGQ